MTCNFLKEASEKKKKECTNKWNGEQLLCERNLDNLLNVI